MTDSHPIEQNSEKPIIKWAPFQKKFIDDPSRFKVGCFSRQTGKTWSACGDVLKSAITAAKNGKKNNWTVLSAGQRQSKTLMTETMEPLVRAFQTFYNAKTGYGIETREFRDEETGWKFSKTEIEIPGGSKITALPSMPATVRGRTTNVLFDEFAFHDDGGREIWRAAFPMVSSRKSLRIIVISTPNGTENVFAKMMLGEEEAKVWSRHHVDIYEAVEQGLYRDIDLLRSAAGDKQLWEQEYELKFNDEAAVFLPYELIMPCETKDACKPMLYNNSNMCYVGVDIGRHEHLFVVTVLERISDHYYIVREEVERRGAGFEEQDAIMDRVMEQYKVAGARVDATGLGMRSAETYEKKYGARCEGVTFTNNSKHDMAQALKRLFEGKMIGIPENIDYREDLHSVQRRTLPSGAFQYDSPTVKGSHADRFWSLSLAALAASQPQVPFHVTPRQPRPSHNGFGLGGRNMFGLIYIPKRTYYIGGHYGRR